MYLGGPAAEAIHRDRRRRTCTEAITLTQSRAQRVHETCDRMGRTQGVAVDGPALVPLLLLAQPGPAVVALRRQAQQLAGALELWPRHVRRQRIRHLPDDTLRVR